MNFNIEHAGYLILIIGLMVEGEVALITGAYMAHRGYLNLPDVVLAALVISIAVDWSYFLLARTKGGALIRNKPKLSLKLNRISDWLEHNSTLPMMFYRFIYGARIAVILTIGFSQYKKLRFFSLSAIGVAIWTATYSLLGYYFGKFLESLVSRIKEFELPLILGVAAVSWLAFYLIKKYRRKALSENLRDEDIGIQHTSDEG